jgi:hypothetical protein
MPPKNFRVWIWLAVFSILALLECCLLFAPAMGMTIAYWPELCGLGLFVLGLVAWYAFPQGDTNSP